MDGAHALSDLNLLQDGADTDISFMPAQNRALSAFAASSFFGLGIVLENMQVGDLTARDFIFASSSEENRPPVAAATNTVVTNEDTPSASVAIGASDLDGDALSYSIKQGFGPAGGTVTFGNGSFSYTPNANANGADAFTIVMDDGHGGTTEQVVSVSVNPVNDRPVAAATNTVVTNEDTPSASVAIGASDLDGDALSYSIKQGFGPAAGTVAFGNGSFSYTPNANANGADAFTIVIDDGHGGTTEQVVSVSVNPVNDRPVAAATSTVVTNEDTPSASVAIGASDLDGDALSYSIKQGFGPAGGTVTFGNGSFSYTPNANANGADAFTIVMDDGHGGTTEQVVSVSVNPVNDRPVCGCDEHGRHQRGYAFGVGGDRGQPTTVMH